jgi:hypothetical protein
VREYGAIPDDGLADTAAIQSALDAAASSGVPCTVLFEPGQYDLTVAPGSSADLMALSLNDASDVVINGSGSLWMIKNPLGGVIRMVKCRRVILRDFSVDYDQVPFSAGVIRGIDTEQVSIDMEVVAPHPPLDQACFSEASGRWGYPLDPEVPGRLAEGCSNVYFSDRIERLTNGLFRIFFEKESSRQTIHWLSVGQRYVQQARNNDGSLFAAKRCRDITFQRITTYAASSLNYVSILSDRTNVLQCRAQIRPGRWKSGNADAVHSQSDRTAPWVEDCDFEGLGDDGSNFYIRPLSVQQIVSSNILVLVRTTGTVQPFPDEEIQVGDTLRFFDPVSGEITGEALVKSMDQPSGRVVLNVPVAGIRPGTDKSCTQVYNRNLCSGFVIRNNRFANSRRYGNLIRGSDGLIEGNRYEGLSDSPVSVKNEPSWPEGFFSRNLLIRNNRMTGCGFEYSYLTRPGAANIQVSAHALNQWVLNSTVQENIRIENNRFENWCRAGVSLSNTRNAVVSGNEFLPPQRRTEAEPPVAIRSGKSERISFQQNVFPKELAPADQIVTGN